MYNSLHKRLYKIRIFLLRIKLSSFSSPRDLFHAICDYIIPGNDDANIGEGKSPFCNFGVPSATWVLRKWKKDFAEPKGCEAQRGATLRDEAPKKSQWFR